MMKKKWGILVGGVLAWVLLLYLLVYAESFGADPSITTLWDAAWYSLITLSTVGYGDLYPVTAAGRLIGIFFVALSVGFLAFLISTVVSLMTGKILPLLRLRGTGRRLWYVFEQETEETAALAVNLFAEEKEAVFVFSGGSGETTYPEGMSVHRIGEGTEAILSLKKKIGGQAHVFVMGPDGYVNYQRATALLKREYPVYCRTEYEPDRVPAILTLFHDYDCCARLFWQQEALKAEESCIVLIGCGKYGGRLLERALQVNVREPGKPVAYHVFGEVEEFCRNHPQLPCVVAVDDPSAKGDAVFFHKEPWNTDGALLEKADRIVLCEDEEKRNMELCRQLSRYFVTEGTVYLRTSMKLGEERCFGAIEEIYRPELVMRTALNKRAAAMHEIYRTSADYPVPAWEELSEFLRQSNIAAADHLLMKLRILLKDETLTEVTPKACLAAYERYQALTEEARSVYRQIEHDRWMRFHGMYNWRYAEKRDNAHRRHHLMRPFAELDIKEQQKDDYAWELLGAIARWDEEQGV